MIDHRIRTFLTLCEQMNYRRAAEKLHMTQPAVTQQIHHLEDHYGVKLFEYDRRRLVITPEGESLRTYAENVLYQEERFAESLKDNTERRLRLGSTKTIGEFVIPGLLERYLSDGKNQLTVEVDNTEKLLGMLKRGELDIALVEGYFDTGEFRHRLYRREEFVGVCGRDHPFAGRSVPLDLVFRNTLFLREQGSGTRQILERFLEEGNRSVSQFDRCVTVNNFGLMGELIGRGCGITFAYRSLTDSDGRLAVFRVEGTEMFRDFNYVFLDTPYSRRDLEMLERLSEE